MLEDKTEADEHMTSLESNNKEFIAANAMMYLDTYQFLAGRTAVYKGRGTIEGLVYCALKLAGEAGELSNKVGKIWGHGLPMDKEALEAELGDVLWYLSQACFEIGANLQGTANRNLIKLMQRKREGKLAGTGDNR